VCRRGLRCIEGFAVRVRFDPDRCTQRTVQATVNRRGRQLLLEVLNPLKSGVRLSHASDGGLALHRISLLAHGHPVLFNRALPPRLPCALRAPRSAGPKRSLLVVEPERQRHPIVAGLPRAKRLRHVHMFTNAQTCVSDRRMLGCVGSWIASARVAGVR